MLERWPDWCAGDPVVEETAHDLRFLLRAQDRGSHCDVHFLLPGDPCVGASS